MARTRVRESTQTLKDFARPLFIPEDAGFEEPIPKSPIIIPGSSITITTTGNIDDLDFGNVALIRMNNASLSTIRGLKAGNDGQQVTIVSVGAGRVDTSHQNTNSAANNRFINYVTTGPTPAAPSSGSFIYQYDAVTARWRLVSHSQGAWLSTAFSAGDYTADQGTWTVQAGDIYNFGTYLNGKTLTVAITLITTDIAGTPTPTNLFIKIPSGWIPIPADLRVPCEIINSAVTVGFNRVVGFDGRIFIYKDFIVSNFTVDTGNTAIFVNISFEIQ